MQPNDRVCANCKHLVISPADLIYVRMLPYDRSRHIRVRCVEQNFTAECDHTASWIANDTCSGDFYPRD